MTNRKDDKSVEQQNVQPSTESVQSDEIRVLVPGEGAIPREPGDPIPFLVNPTGLPPETPAADPARAERERAERK